MNTAQYAARNATAHQRMLDAAQRIAQTEGFADIADLLKAAHHKDRQVAALFQREAFAAILERLASYFESLPDDRQTGRSRKREA